MSMASVQQFFRDIGRDVIELDGITWVSTARFLYSPIPYDLEVSPDKYDLDRLFSGKCQAVRCTVPAPWGRESYRLVISNPEYDLGDLDSKSRNQTRRGMEACTTRRISFAELAVDGVALHIDTMIRQGRKSPGGTADYWRHYFECAGRTDCASAWAAYVGDELAAYLVALTLDRTAHIVIVRSATRFLRHYPNNALLFSYARALMRERTVDEISIGYESLQSTMTSLDHFKEGLGFNRQIVNRYVQLSPLCRTVLRGPVLSLTKVFLNRIWPGETARKISGLLDWHASQRPTSARTP